MAFLRRNAPFQYRRIHGAVHPLSLATTTMPGAGPAHVERMLAAEAGTRMERVMKRRTGSPRPHLASSITEKAKSANLAANLEQRLHLVLAKLEQCRSALIGSDRETTELVSVTILQLRMQLNRIADSDLKALCDAMMADEPVRELVKQSHGRKLQGQRRRPAALLKLVK
jgi:hypothetical protein